MPKADDYRPLQLVEPTANRGVGKLQAALLPFARAASDYEPPKSKLYRDEEHVALRITAGDLRTARHVLLENKQPVTTEQRYSLAEMEQLSREYCEYFQPNLDMVQTQLELSLFLEFLKKREREVGGDS